MKRIKAYLGQPDNSHLIQRAIRYGIILVAVGAGVPLLCKLFWCDWAFSGMLFAWFTLFLPVMALLMLCGLRRDMRRRWGWAFMRRFYRESIENGLTTCPRCGGELEERQGVYYRRRYLRTEVRNEGSKQVRTAIYERERVEYTYHQCNGACCQLVVEDPDTKLKRANIPYKKRQLRALILDERKCFTRSRPNANEMLMPRLHLISTLLVVAIVAIGAFSMFGYWGTEQALWEKSEILADTALSEEALHGALLAADETYNAVSVNLTTVKPDYYAETYHKRDAFVSVGTRVVAGERIFECTFEGNDMGTGLPDGDYYLLTFEGEPVLASSTTRRLYRADSEFYKTYEPKLRALTVDSVMQGLLDKVAGGQRGTNDSEIYPVEIAKKGDTYLWTEMKTDARDQVGAYGGAVEMRGDIRDEYRFHFSDDDRPVDLNGYFFADAAVATEDELSKLLATAGEKGRMNYDVYDGDKRVLAVNIEAYPTGYTFTFGDAYDRFEEDGVYRVNLKERTLIQLVEENGKETEKPLPLSEYQTEYDYLLSILPDTYMHSVFDWNKAEVKSEFFGLMKRYRMKGDDGQVTAEVAVAFGKFQGFVHYLPEGGQVKIDID